MVYFCGFIGFAGFFDEDGDCYSGFYVEDVLIGASVWRLFFFSGAAVQVVDVYICECVHELLSHTAESEIIEVSVVCYESEDSCAGLLDAPLSESDEFDVVVLQPFGISFA